MNNYINKYDRFINALNFKIEITIININKRIKKIS